mmetsp:Transcript_52380/g.122891  ORF Transcript_52380/g.122891 Transcript_52380/m.122891 type:complete len:231 (-) Transcript_52380:694-1386(-)
MHGENTRDGSELGLVDGGLHAGDVLENDESLHGHRGPRRGGGQQATGAAGAAQPVLVDAESRDLHVVDGSRRSHQRGPHLLVRNVHQLSGWQAHLFRSDRQSELPRSDKVAWHTQDGGGERSGCDVEADACAGHSVCRGSRSLQQHAARRAGAASRCCGRDLEQRMNMHGLCLPSLRKGVNEPCILCREGRHEVDDGVVKRSIVSFGCSQVGVQIGLRRRHDVFRGQSVS